jgi:acyl-CoA thioesterase-1
MNSTRYTDCTVTSLRSFHAVLALCLLMALAACRGKADDPNASNQERRAAPVQAPDDGSAPERPKIVALGDSLTAGLGLLEQQAYPALLQKKLDAEGYEFDVVNAGVSGDTSAGGLRRLDWALEGDVRVLIVALGANDGLRGLSVAQMKKNLAEIIEQARDRGIVVILAGMEAPPNYGPEYTAAFRQAYQEVAREQRVLFIPFLLADVAGQPTLNQGDGIHPNTEGAAVMAETVWRVLRPVLDQMPDAP